MGIVAWTREGDSNITLSTVATAFLTMADTVVVDQNEMSEDIATKEKLQEDVPTVEKDEEMSNASMGVNEVTSTGEQNNDSTSGADGDGVGNSENVEDTSSSEQKESTKSSSLPICKQCNFVFITPAALEKHETSENHKMVVNGFKPSLGEHYCFLCWRGYNRPGVLQSHYNGPSHAEQVERQGVKAIWKKAEVETEHKGDEFKCPACNLVFVSEQSEQNHRQSERHTAVIQRSRPQDVRGRPGRYCCFLCWHGFEFTDQLCRHYSHDKAHTDRMKRYGVEKLLVDERTRVKEKRRRTPSPDKVIYVHRREYIVIDEWSEELEKAKQEEKTPVEDEKNAHKKAKIEDSQIESEESRSSIVNDSTNEMSEDTTAPTDNAEN